MKAPKDFSDGPHVGLFDVGVLFPHLLSHLNGSCQFGDVNAFLTSAATRHTYTPEYIAENPRVAGVLEAAKTGRVTVGTLSSKVSYSRVALAILIDMMLRFVRKESTP